ncbi:MAG: glyoxalase [Burkholderiales bacterium]|jgi:catechol 2,3-dioxygenase-like lactoylglutathione lyase family enzyme|nr:glyoxalase [Burkholderiales bacterium]
MRLRSVELELPDLGQAAEFLERAWGLVPAGSAGGTRFFRGTGDHPYILSLAQATAPAVSAITFSGSEAEIARQDRSFDVPGGGKGFEISGPEGQTYRFIIEKEVAKRIEDRDKPIQLTHAVINSTDVEACERFAVEKLGFKVSDRTAHMRFVRCNRKHHALAYAKSELASLNHIAFEMQDVDAVMRGIGRLRDAGYDVVWGPGRHGPGNNVFGYFIAPWGGIVEYTAEVSEVGDDYKVGSPEDWKWPPGRIDHWGVSKKDTARTSAAERVLRFRAT